jgi:L-threonylcarbamoyladenylate synthase
MAAPVVPSSDPPPNRILPPSSANIERAARRIEAGGIVAYPTETVFGLAANPFDESALARLFALKDRLPDKPVLLLIHDPSELDLLTESVPQLARDLMVNFWPGPLTLLFPARGNLSPHITSGSRTVAVRQSSNPTAQALCLAAGMPITSTSANRSSERPATTSKKALGLLPHPEDLVLEGTCPPGALPSTIVDATGKVPVIVREGAIPSVKLGF